MDWITPIIPAGSSTELRNGDGHWVYQCRLPKRGDADGWLDNMTISALWDFSRIEMYGEVGANHTDSVDFPSWTSPKCGQGLP